MTCAVGCYECSALCLCKCHKPAPVNVPMRYWDDLFDDVRAKKKIFFDDIKTLKLYDEGMDKLTRFIFSRGYILRENVFIHD